MLPTFLVTGAVFAIAMTGMAIGVILSNRRLRGSCGGLARLHDAEGKSMCEGCSHPSTDCTGENLPTP